MDATGCISNQAWQDYAAGKLDEQSKELLLRHAASCVICSDILEGIDSMEQPALLSRHIQQINKAVDLRTRKTWGINTAWYAAAAILIMACGFAWYLFTPRTEQPVALRQQEETAPEKPVREKNETIRSKEQPIEAPQIQHAPAKNKPAAPALSTVPEKPVIISRKRAIVDIEEPKAATQAEQPVSLADASVSESKSIDDANKQAADQETEIATAGSRNVSQQKTAAKKSKETYPSAYSANSNTGLNNYNFRGARSASDSTVYRSALVQYEAKQYDSCKVILSNLVLDTASAYYEEGMLLMAKAHIDTGEKEAAKGLLKKVIGLNGSRKKDARELLNALK